MLAGKDGLLIRSYTSGQGHPFATNYGGGRATSPHLQVPTGLKVPGNPGVSDIENANR